MAGWKISFSNPYRPVYKARADRHLPSLNLSYLSPIMVNLFLYFFLSQSFFLYIPFFPLYLLLFYCLTLSLSLSVFLAYLAEDRPTPACLAFLNPSLCLHSTLLLKGTAWEPTPSPLMILALFLVPHPNP